MTVVRVTRLIGDFRGSVKLGNRFVKIHIPKRSKLFNGKKPTVGDLYELTLKEVKTF